MTRPLLLLTLLTALALPSLASAEGLPQGDESPKHFTTSLNFGGHWLSNDDIQTVYGSQGRFYTQLQFGLVPWSRYVHVEFDFGLGFSQFSGSQVAVDTGATSSDKVMLTMFPLTVDLLLGVDLVEEQPVVPYGGLGLNYTLWREQEHGGGDKWEGDRFGGSLFFGAAFLLDVLERSRSRQLDASTGINDVYLTVEGRYRQVDSQIVDGALSQAGLDFDGWSLAAGLKFVY